MTAVLLALGASLAWGVADFIGPWKARTLGALRVMLWAQFGGLTAITIVVAIHAKPPHNWALLLAIPAALSGTLGLYAYYRGMAVGAMAVVAPIAGASAIVPVIFGLVTGDRPSSTQIARNRLRAGRGLVRFPGASGRRAARCFGVGLAILAAIGFGFYFPAMHVAGRPTRSGRR